MFSTQSIKRKIKALLGRSSTTFKVETTRNHQWYGNKYGGFFVCPDDLTENSIVYSFGLGEDISFDEAILAQHHCKVFGFDPTPKSLAWLRSTKQPTGFSFFDFGLNNNSGEVTFNLPKKKEYVSGSIINHSNVTSENSVTVQMKSLTDISEQFGHKHISILKMDIEGSEYAVIDTILSTPIKIDQILLEIHERFFPDGKDKTKKLLDSLHQHGYKLFATSETFEELSFIRTP